MAGYKILWINYNTDKERTFDFKNNADNLTCTVLWKYRSGGIAAAGGYQEAGCDANISEKTGMKCR